MEVLATLRHLSGDASVRVTFVIMDGFETLEAIRSVKSLDRIPILISTGTFTESNRARCVVLDVEYAEKPADLPALTKLVEEICRSHCGECRLNAAIRCIPELYMRSYCQPRLSPHPDRTSVIIAIVVLILIGVAFVFLERQFVPYGLMPR